ncbi:MAG: MauE/DoxX family redox-associated membrane protein [bacterium]
MSQRNQRWAVLFIRLFLGGIFLIAAYGKIVMGGVPTWGTDLYDKFSQTFLPRTFLTVFIYVLPFAELAAGIGLLLGIYRKGSFMLAIMLFMVLSQGEFMVQEYATAAHNGVYFLTSIAGLVMLSKPCFAIDSYFTGPTTT